MPNQNKKTVLIFVWLALLVGLVAALPLLYKFITPGGETKPTPSPKMDAAKLAQEWPQIVAHAAAPLRGKPNTPYTMAEFGDFQCPQCGKAAPLLPQFLSHYPAQVNLIFIHRPFAFHQWAVPAAQASEIAAKQGKFWPMYDLLYSEQDNLESGFYGDYAAQVGLKKADFNTAFAAKQGLDQVTESEKFADSIGIRETPTILLRDNAQGTIKIYVGLDGTKNADGSPQYPGVKELLTNPPWVKSVQ